MRLASRRHAWLCRGLTGFGLAAPLALAPVLPVTVSTDTDRVKPARVGKPTAGTPPVRATRLPRSDQS